MTRIRLPPRTERRLSVETSSGFVSLHRIYYLHYTLSERICQEVFKKSTDASAASKAEKQKTSRS